MRLDTVIFDMDGVLIDSEPCWQQAGDETLLEYNISLTDEDHHSTTGLRTRDWLDWWFTRFEIDKCSSKDAESKIFSKVIEKIKTDALPLDGVDYIFNFFKERNFKIGLATSSPVSVIEVVAEKLGIRDMLNAISSADELTYSKPHPEVYLNCASILNSSPLQCLCFEDSFNGIIAAKAARMKCVAIPAISQRSNAKWNLADMQLTSLTQFNDELLEKLHK